MEAKFLKKTSGKLRGRIIALVQSGLARKRQSAVFALKSKRFSQPILKGVYPITPAFRCKGLSGTRFSIAYEGVDDGEEYLFEVSRITVKELLVPMMTALKTAREAGAVVLDWLSYYAIVDQPDNNPESALATVGGGAGPSGSDGGGGAAVRRSGGGESESDDEDSDFGDGGEGGEGGRGGGGDQGDREGGNGESRNSEGREGGAGESGMGHGGGGGSGESKESGAWADGEEDDEAHNPLIGSSGRALSNPDAVMDIKEQWIQEQMQLREDEFTEKVPFRLFVGTWNVNGKKPGEELDPWLNSSEPADIYAVGFQELDLSAEAFLLNNTTRSAPWEQHIETALSKRGDYVLITSKQLVGILLTVYVRTEFLPYISDVQTDVAGVGIMGVMGNKGGVAIRFRFHDSSFCFVNSHLAARMGNVQRRNQDHKEICRRLAFQVGGGDSSGDDHLGSGGSGKASKSGSGRAFGIFDHDFLFWLGDLNYRISNMTDVEVKARISEEDWDSLVVNDQLTTERAAKRTFVGFKEGRLAFKPTYKYDPGTSRFDTSEKKRLPAWCDRVLWISRRSELVQTFYGGHHELMTSDHKPVSAVYESDAKIIVKERKALIYHTVVRELDQLENESMPDASLSSSTFVFDEVYFKVPVTQTLIVHNTGQVMIHFSFIPKPGDTQSAYCPPWLSIEPDRGLLMPGKSAEVTFTICVEGMWGSRLTIGEAALDSVLILHLENGKDYFVNVQGNYAKSCFGASLNYLSRVVEPVRTGPSPAEGSVLSIPKELWWLVDYLYTHSTDDEGLFQESGDEGEMEAIRDLLDTGMGLLTYDGSVHSVAESLLKFLGSLASPVIPFRMLPRAIDAAESSDLAHDLVGVLPIPNYNVFVYITAFLRELVDLSDSLTPSRLAYIFSAVLLRRRDGEEGGMMTRHANRISKKKAQFVFWFLGGGEGGLDDGCLAEE